MSSLAAAPGNKPTKRRNGSSQALARAEGVAATEVPFKVVRWGLTVTLALLGFVAVAATYVDPALRVCRDVVAGDHVVQACSPLGTNDVVLVASYGLLVMLPVVAEVSGFAIAGLVSVNRRHSMRGDDG